MPEALQKPGGRGGRTGVIHGSSRTPPVPGCRLPGCSCLCGDRFGLIVFTWFGGWIKFRGIGQWQVFTPISQVRKLRLREARKEPQPVVVPPAGRLRITTNFPEHEAKVNPISPPTPPAPRLAQVRRLLGVWSGPGTTRGSKARRAATHHSAAGRKPAGAAAPTVPTRGRSGLRVKSA